MIKKTISPEPAGEYCKNRVTPCPCFEAGQDFVCSLVKPENFCDRAWRDIHLMVAVLLAGGNFSRGVFNGWMKDDRTLIGCYTDGIRPVIFRKERIEG